MSGKKLGMTVKELQEAKEGSITDLGIAINLIDYALTYQDDKILLKIYPLLVGEALIEYVKQMEIT